MRRPGEGDEVWCFRGGKEGIGEWSSTKPEHSERGTKTSKKATQIRGRKKKSLPQSNES